MNHTGKHQKHKQHAQKHFDGRVTLMMADILQLNVDVIVNPANASLLGGGGLDGQMHNAAGSRMTCEAQRLGGCDVGDAKVTKGYRLPCEHVIHAVPPAWFDHTPDVVRAKLQQTYRAIFREADKLGAKAIAIPAIGTGIFRIPIKFAAAVLFEELQAYFASHESQLVLLPFVDPEKLQTTTDVFDAIAGQDGL